MRTPGAVAVGSEHDLDAGRIDLRQVAGLNAVGRLLLRPVGVALFELGVFGGRQARLQPAQILLDAAVGKVRVDDEVRVRLVERQHFVVDVLVAHAVCERVDPGADEPLAVFLVEDVRGDAKAVLVSLVDRGLVLRRKHLVDLAFAIVDPDLDDVDLVLRVRLHRLARLLDAVDLEVGRPSVLLMPLPALKKRAMPGVSLLRRSSSS